MWVKIPFTDILNFLKEKGYIALIDEKDYKGSSYPFPGLCPLKHECNINVRTLKKGNGCCKICANKKRAQSGYIDIPFEKILEAAKKYGFKILTLKEEYKGKENKIQGLCPKLHECQINVTRFVKNGKCCKKCGVEITTTKTRTPFSEMLKILYKIGYTTLIDESEWKGTTYSFPGLCSKKHPCNIILDAIKKGSTCCKICGLEKAKKTCLERFGAETPMLNSDVYKKYRESCLKNLGVPHPMQNTEVFQKWQQSCFSTKKYLLPSCKIINFQGYENFCYDDLLFREGYFEEELMNANTDDNKMPDIWYFIEGVKHRYFPDIFIPHENKVIEVKSRYTFECNKEINLLKLQSTIDAGYISEIRIYDEKGNIEEIITEIL